MKSIRVTAFGGPGELRLVEGPDPVPGESDLVVRTEAIGVNYIDTYFRTGAYAVDLPYVPGSEAVGRVTAVGARVADVSVGDRVAWCAAPGSYAELVRVPAEVAVPAPEHLTAPQAASVLLQGMTAHYLLNSAYAAQPGETVLIHAGAGGVGLMFTQLAVERGVRVLTTVSTPEKARLSYEAGAAEVLGYDDFAARVLEITDGAGVAAVYDGVGKDTFDDGLTCIRRRGTMVLFGAASGPVPPFDPQRLNSAGSLFLTRPTLAHYTASREELLWRSSEIFAAVRDGILDVRVGATFPLAEAAAAHTALENRETTGSVVLIP